MDVLRTTGYQPRPPFLVAREQGFFVAHCRGARLARAGSVCAPARDRG